MVTVKTPSLFTRAFILAALANFFHGCAFHAFVHLSGTIQSFGASEFTIGWVLAIHSIVALLARPFIGSLLDRQGRKNLFLGGGLLHVAACSLYLNAHEVGPWLVTARVVHGIAHATLFSVLFTVAADLVRPPRQAQGLAWFAIFGIAALPVGGWIGDTLAGPGKESHLFLAAAAFAAVGFLVTLPIPECRPMGVPSTHPGFWRAILQKPLRVVWFLGICYAVSISSAFLFLKTYVAGSSVQEVGWFFTPFALAAIFLRIGGGGWPDRIGLKTALVPAVLSTVIGLGLLSRQPEQLGLVIAGGLCGLGHGYTFPILIAMVTQRVNPNERGSAIACLTALFDAGSLFGGPFLGLVIEQFRYPVMFLAAAATPAIGLGVFLLLDRNRSEIEREVVL